MVSFESDSCKDIGSLPDVQLFVNGVGDKEKKRKLKETQWL